MDSTDFTLLIEASRRERDRIVRQRRQQLAGLRCEIPELLYDPDDGLPRYPWAWFRDRLVVLRPSDTAGLPNQFGGEHGLTWQGLAGDCSPHLLLRFAPSSLSLDLPADDPVADRLPLCYPFRSSQGSELVYRQAPDGTLLAQKSPASHPDDQAWPYPDYPAVLPARGLEVDGPYPVPFLGLFPLGGGRTLSVQDLPEDGDRFLIVVVTARAATLGVSLFGSDAEAEAAQVVFVVDPSTWVIWAYSQCL